MKCFYLPTLETLDINDATESERYIGTLFTQPKFPNVRTLRLEFISESIGNNFPQVTDLDIVNLDAASTVLGDVHRWPLLRRLNFTYCDLKALRKILEDRIVGDHPIITLSLTCHNKWGRHPVAPELRNFETDWLSNYKPHPSDLYTLHWQGKHGWCGSVIVTISLMLTLHQLTTSSEAEENIHSVVYCNTIVAVLELYCGLYHIMINPPLTNFS